MGFRELQISRDTPEALLPGLLKAVEKRVVKVTSLRVPCPATAEACEFITGDENRRRRAVSLASATLETAARFAAGCVVLELGKTTVRETTPRLEQMAFAGSLHSRSYVAEKLRLVAEREKAGALVLERARAVLDALLPQCERHQVRLGLATPAAFEQAPAPAEMETLLREYADSPWIGVWHDFGHVQRQANLGFLDHEEFLTLTAPRLLGCQAHDVAWPARDHQIPLSQGGVDFDCLLPLLPDGIPLVWTLNPKLKRLGIIAAREAWEQRFGV